MSRPIHFSHPARTERGNDFVRTDRTVFHSRTKRGLSSVRSTDGSQSAHIFFGMLRVRNSK
jgi:hypothetical protein